MKYGTIRHVAVVALAVAAWRLPGAAAWPKAPDRWEIRPIAGERLRAGYYAGEWIASNRDEAPDWRIFKDRMLPQFCSYRTLGLRGDVADEKRWKKPVYTIEDCLTKQCREAIARYEREFPGQPYYINLAPGDFRSFFYFPVAKPDVAGFGRWRAAHPAFAGFRSICEFDGGMSAYFNEWSLPPAGSARREYLDREYPRTSRLFDEQLALVERGIARQREAMFGCADHYDIFSICPTWAHVCARSGTRLVMYEAELCATSGGWSAGTWFARGASRQWNVPWAWYQASFKTTTDRKGNERDGKGRKLDKMNEIRRKGHEDVVELCGASFSLLSRGWHYGWFAGSSVLEAERYDSYFIEDGPDGRTRPSKYAREFNSVFELDERVDRGVPYTPCAYLCSIGEPFYRYGYSTARDPFSQNAFFWTLAPTKTRSHYTFREGGSEGCFWNSPFCEMGDVLCPDAGQGTDDFAAALSAYRVAILVGTFVTNSFDAAAVARFVEGGGRVYLNDAQLGLLNAKLARDGSPALAPSSRVVVVPDFVDAGFRASPGDAYSDKFRKIASGEKTFPEVERLMRGLQDELLPVKVAGDCQWGVNRTKRGWLVWLMNNKGVTKYALEEEEIDHSFDTEVAVTYKPSGETRRVKVPAGGFAWAEFGD